MDELAPLVRVELLRVAESSREARIGLNKGTRITATHCVNKYSATGRIFKDGTPHLNCCMVVVLTLSRVWAQQVNLADRKWGSNREPGIVNFSHLGIQKLSLKSPTKDTRLPDLLGQVPATYDVGLAERRNVYRRFIRALTLIQ